MGNRAQASPFGHQGVQTRSFDFETLGLDINDLESVDLNSVKLETLGLEAVTFETVGAVMVGAETVNLGAVDQEIMDFGSGTCGTRGINTVRRPVRPGLVWSGLIWTARPSLRPSAQGCLAAEPRGVGQRHGVVGRCDGHPSRLSGPRPANPEALPSGAAPDGLVFRCRAARLPLSSMPLKLLPLTGERRLTSPRPVAAQPAFKEPPGPGLAVREPPPGPASAAAPAPGAAG